MEQEYSKTYKIVDVCLLAGKIMLQSGGETYRVEDTMTRIANAFGIYGSHCYVTPTGIIFSIDGVEPTKLVRIVERSTDLKKVTVINSISRKIASGELQLEEAYQKLKEAEKADYKFPMWIQIAAATLASGCFLIMFQGQWKDFIPAMITGGIGYLGLLYFDRIARVRFFAEFVSSFIMGLVAALLVKIGIGTEIDKIIIGSVMPLVPGLLITNAIRDLMVGHLVAGLSKGAEAFLTAFAIGAGIAVVLSFR